MPTFRSAVVLLALPMSGCALFGDPLLGKWELLESDLHGPLTTTSVEDQATTTTTLSGEMVLEDLEDGVIFGTYTEAIKVRVVSPEGNSTERSEETVEVEAREESGDEYALDVDTVGDWLCFIHSSDLECEDDDGNDILFERIAEGRKL